MGKYMRKSKGTGGVALMEVSHTQPSLGVRTRAKTLALQSLQNSSSSAAAAGDGEGGGGGGSYLQLRSRRLEKVSPDGKRRKLSQTNMNLLHKSPSSRLRLKGIEEKKEKAKEKRCFGGEKLGEEIKEEEDKKSNGGPGGGDLGIEQTSFGENVLEFEGRERTTRESTPCNSIRDADAIRIPESSTRPSTVGETPHNRENLAQRQIPASHEMEAFFSCSEEQQQRKFVEKYNYDPATDQPLPGRFEWEKLNH